MFAGAATSTPFSVRDILNLQHHPDMASLGVSSGLDSPPSPASCMLERTKQQHYSETPSVSAYDEPLSKMNSCKNNPDYSSTSYVNDYLEISNSEAKPSNGLTGKSDKGKKGNLPTFQCVFNPSTLLTCIYLILHNVPGIMFR